MYFRTTACVRSLPVSQCAARILSLVALSIPAAQAQTPGQIPYNSPQEASVAIDKDPNATLTPNGDGWHTVQVSQGPNEGIWSFVPQSHPAFPGVVKLQVLEKDGHLFIAKDALCGGSKIACDQLIQESTRRNERIVKDAIDRRKSQ